MDINTLTELYNNYLYDANYQNMVAGQDIDINDILNDFNRYLDSINIYMHNDLIQNIYDYMKSNNTIENIYKIIIPKILTIIFTYFDNIIKYITSKNIIIDNFYYYKFVIIIYSYYYYIIEIHNLFLLITKKNIKDNKLIDLFHHYLVNTKNINPPDYNDINKDLFQLCLNELNNQILGISSTNTIKKLRYDIDISNIETINSYIATFSHIKIQITEKMGMYIKKIIAYIDILKTNYNKTQTQIQKINLYNYNLYESFDSYKNIEKNRDYDINSIFEDLNSYLNHIDINNNFDIIVNIALYINIQKKLIFKIKL
jgi:hypothetical protein